MSYKYQLSYATRTQFVTPKKQGKIVVTKEEGEAFFREKLTGSIELSGEDYDFLVEAELYSVKCCQDINLAIYEACSGEAENMIWNGGLTLFEISWDHDNKTATIEKANVKDDYAEIFANWTKEVNLLEFPDKITVMLDAGRGTANPIFVTTDEGEDGSEDNDLGGSNYHTRCMDFIEVLRYLIKQTLQLSSRQHQATREELSTFFSAAKNPVTGRTNIFNDVVIAHLSDVKRPSASNPAVTGKTTLKEMLNALKQTFNVYWFIDPQTNFIRLEHISFFPHLSYEPIQQTLDLTAPGFKEIIEGKNAYSSDNSDLFSTEGLELTLNGAISDYLKDNPGQSYKVPQEFSTAFYMYGNECIPLDSKGERTEKITTSSYFFTDVLSARVYPVALPENGWALLQAPMKSRIRTIESAYVPLSNQLVHNGNLAASALWRDYHRYNVSFSYGSLSDTKVFTGQPMRSKSVKPTMQFKDVEFSNCCGSRYDFSGLVKHPSSSGATVKQLEYDLETQTIIVSLVGRRECESNPVPDDRDPDEQPGNSCPKRGTELRVDEKLIYCPVGTRRQLHAVTRTTVYADGECGEYSLGGTTSIIKPC